MFEQKLPFYIFLLTLHVTTQSLEWPMGRLISPRNAPTSYDPQQSDEEQPSTAFVRKYLEDRTILNLLSLLKGIPQNLSKDEIKQLRENAPMAVKDWSDLVNNEHLLMDLSHGKITSELFDDLRKSISFLEINPCNLQFGEGTQMCLVRREPLPKPNSPIYTAHLITHILPWINPNQVQLNLFLLNKYNSQLERKVFHLAIVNESRPNFKNPTFHEITWDITHLVKFLHSEQGKFQYPILMTLDYSGQGEQMNMEILNFGQEFGLTDKAQILAPNAQVIVEIQTPHTKQLKILYSPRRIRGRSFLADSLTTSGVKYCPSFLDLDERETKCCLFRYTLNKKQMDQNDRLRFIIFPHHLPMNMCHGRCIGLFMPTDNAHTILMNRYFSGLGPTERMKIYNSMPCCAANESIAFTIVYRNDQKQLVTETLFNAVKTSCACR